MANDEVVKPTFPYQGYVPPMAVAKPEETAKIMAEDTVTMYFPHPVLYTLPNHQRVQYNVGVQEVPESISKSPYLAAHGAKIHDAAQKIKMTDVHVKFLNSPEYRRVTNVEDAQKYFDALSKQEQSDFLTAAAKFESPTLPDVGALNIFAQSDAQGEDVITEMHVNFLISRGYNPTSVDAAKNFYSNLSPEERGGFLKSASLWAAANPDKALQPIVKAEVPKPDAVVKDPSPITTKEVEEAKKAEDAKAADAAKAEAKKAEDAKLKPAAPAKK